VSADAPVAIAVDHLEVLRGDNRVLQDLSLNIARGVITGLLGPSGSGKTTFLRTIVGLQAIKSGSVTVFGEPAGSASLRPRLGYVTQAPAVYADITVFENLQYFARVLNAPDQAIARVLDEVSLGSYRDRIVGTLSGGERARVSLATAMLHSPELLVLDEPTVGLDPVLRDQLWTMFNELAETGITLLISSHVMDEAERCHSLILLREGKVLAHATLDELRQRTGAADAEGAFLSLVRGGSA
jgi:ABC-2 type transport system ATP-binding protein